MMKQELIVAGFGGQGVLLVGKLIAKAALEEGKEVSWLPSYGPEMRGGTANCTVVVSDKPVGSPVVSRPNMLIVMNRPSLDKFESSMMPGGTMLVNSSLINVEPKRTDVKIYKLAANDIAVSVGNPKAANMAILGAYVALSKTVTLEQMQHAVEEQFANKKAVIPGNLAALKAGYDQVLAAMG